jgi:hypothetical protein
MLSWLMRLLRSDALLSYYIEICAMQSGQLGDNGSVMSAANAP